MYCYLEFKLHYHKNLKLFSISVKELFEPIVLQKKKGRWVFALSKAFSWEIRSLSNGSWFYSKKCKTGKGNLYSTENQLSWNEMCCAADNHNHICHTCAKHFFYIRISKQLLTKYKIFKKLPQISHIHKNCNFQVYLHFFRPAASSL